MSDTIFDLEQKILQFANILDDLETFVSKIEQKDRYKIDTEISHIIGFYHFKYNDLWNTFEEHTKDYHKKKSNVYDDLPSDVEPQEYKDDPQGVYEIDENDVPKWL